MDKKIILSINSIQAYDISDSKNAINLVTEAKLGVEDGVFYIEYEESELTGLEGTKTYVEIGKNYVSVIRNGTVNTEMLFMKNRRTSTMYNTQYGNLTVDVFTTEMNIDMKKNGGTVIVDYLIDINGTENIKNNFKLEFKEA